MLQRENALTIDKHKKLHFRKVHPSWEIYITKSGMFIYFI